MRRLLVPVIAKRLVGSDYRYLIPTSAILGAARKAAVEIDHVQELRTGCGEELRLGRRICDRHDRYTHDRQSDRFHFLFP